MGKHTFVVFNREIAVNSWQEWQALSAGAKAIVFGVVLACLTGAAIAVAIIMVVLPFILVGLIIVLIATCISAFVFLAEEGGRYIVKRLKGKSS